MSLSSINTPKILEDMHFTEYVNRINNSIDSDPSLAIGSTKELLESVLKSILDECDFDWDRSDDLPKLLKKVQNALHLISNDTDSKSRGSQGIQEVLRGLSQIVNGIAQLRNIYGTGHGRERGFQGLAPRHARFVAHSGIAICEFLLEVCEYKENIKLSHLSKDQWKLGNTLSQSYGTRTIAFHPNQALIAIGGTDHLISIYSFETGELIAQHKRYYYGECSGDVNSLVFDHSGKLIISTGFTSGSKGLIQEKIQVLEWETGKRIVSLPPLERFDSKKSLALHPNRDVIAFESNSSIIVYSVDLKNCITTLRDRESKGLGVKRRDYQVNHLCFSSDGSLLASSSQIGKVILWHWEQETVYYQASFGWAVYVTAISYGNRILAIGGACHDIILIDLNNKQESKLEGHSQAICSLHFSADHKLLVSASKDGTAKIWHVKTGTLLHTIETNSNRYQCEPLALFSPDSQNLVVHLKDRDIQIWTRNIEP